MEERCPVCGSRETHPSNFMPGLWYCKNHSGMFVPEGQLVVKTTDVDKKKIELYEDQIKKKEEMIINGNNHSL